jgi:cell division protein FtsN
MKYAEVQKSWKITRLDDKKAGKTFYTIGEFEKESDAIKMEDKLREKGSTGLVVSFKGSEKVDILANESGRLYQIQLGSFKKRLTKGEFDQKFSSIPDTLTINSFVDPKTEMTTYIVGNFPNYKQASDVRNVLKQLGVDCFIITSENKNLVASNNALKDAEKKKIEELKEVEKGKDNKKSQSKIEYRIQIGAFKKNLDKKEIEQQYPNIPNKYKIKETLDDASGMNIYTVGNYKTYEEALELQKKLKEGGASGFVVVYENSKKIPLNGIKEETKTKTEAETATKKEKATKQESKKEKEEKKQAKKKKETTKTKETKEEKKLSAKKEEKKDVPEEKKEVVKKKESVIIDYKIQLASYDKPLSNSEFNEKFSDVSKKYIIEIIVDPASGTNYYTIGSYNKYDDAVDFKSALKRQGIYGFVIAFKDAKKISLYDARKSEK